MAVWARTRRAIRYPVPISWFGDATGDYYVEVSMFSDDESSGLIIDELREFLANSTPRCRVDVTLPRALSMPASSHDDREVKYAKIREVVEKFKQRFAQANRKQLPLPITVDDVVFDVSASGLNVGYPGLINTDAFEVPTQEFVKIIRYRVGEKAKKRSKWTGDDLRKRYIIAIDSDQIFMDEDELSEALIGSGHCYQPPLKIPKRPIFPMITTATSSGWRAFLEKVHLIPLAQSIIDPYGCFITDSLTSNVSGVLLRVGSKVWFVPNPFADAQINDPNLVRFLDGP